MKKQIQFTCILILIVMAGCKKGGTITPQQLTNAQAADLIAYELAVNSSGFASVKADIALNAQNMVANNTPCGTVVTSAIARQEPASSLINYNYALGYTYTMNCVNNIQDNIQSDVTFDGSYDGARASSINNGTANIVVSGLAATTIDYTLSGSYSSAGTYQSTSSAGAAAGSNTITLTLNNVTLKKTNRAFSGGSGTVNVSGNVSNKSNFSFNGLLQFTGNGNATLTLEGYTYVINLTTAEVTAG